MQIEPNNDQILSTFYCLNELRESQGNFKIKVNGETIMAHRDILIGASQYFRALLTSDMKEKHMEQVEMNGIDCDCLKICIDFVYGKRVFIPRDLIPLVLQVSMYLQLDSLSETLENFLINSINEKNFWEIQDLADCLLCKYLLEKCQRFIEKNIKVLRNHTRFNDINDKILGRLIQSNRTRLSEKEKFILLKNWMTHKSERKRKAIKLLKKLNFDKIPNEIIQESEWISQEFLSQIQQSKEHLRAKQNVICMVLEKEEHLHFLDLQTEQLCKTQYKKLDSRYRYSILTINQHIYAVGPLKTLHCLKLADHETQWEKLRDMTFERGWWPPSIVVWGEIYVIGGGDGVYSNNIEKYSPDDKWWEDMGNTPHKSQGSEVVSMEDCIYMIGGRINEEYVDYVNKLEGSETSWVSLPPMREKRAFASAIVDSKGHIIVAGGLNENGSSDTVESYNVETEQWSQLPNMNIARWAFQFYCINKTYISIGGRNGLNASSSFEKYNTRIVENCWELREAENITVSTSMICTGTDSTLCLE